jgi:plastocyanin
MKETLQPNFVFTGMKMFMTDTVKVNSGSVLTWYKNSNLPHNIVGIYKKSAARSPIPVDSGIIQPNESWRYNFNDGF